MRLPLLVIAMCLATACRGQATYPDAEVLQSPKRQFGIGLGHRRFLNDAPALQIGVKYQPLPYLALRSDAFYSRAYGLESITGITGILHLSKSILANLGPAYSYNLDGDGKSFFGLMGGLEIPFLPRWQVRLGGQAVFRPTDVDYGSFAGISFWL